MDGYINHETRVLNEWYNIFKQKKNDCSITEYKLWENIKKIGLPKVKSSHWKHTAFTEFFNHHFIYYTDTTLTISQFKKLSLSIDCNRLVFINGKFSTQFSDINIHPWILKTDSKFYLYKKSDSIQPTIFLYLIKYLSDSIIQIFLPEKSVPKKPLYLLYINSGSHISNQLNTIPYYCSLNIGKNTNSSIIEHSVSINNYGHFTGSYVHISIQDQSKLHHTKLISDNNFSYHISYHDIYLEQFSNINSNIFTISGPKFTSHQTNSQINYSESSLCLNSLSILSNKDIGNIKTYVEHKNQGYSTSRQLHKIIAYDHSTGVFNGLIKVAKNSSKTNGKMINNNLLLSQSASIFSTPKLEIYSDAVQCNHGASIGQIDSNHIFYLNTRGIPKKEAIKMLIYAFSYDIINTIQYPSYKNIILKKINKFIIEKDFQ